MSIKRYVPKINDFVDHRNSEGGYYIADCDECGTEYYPLYRNSEYCSDNCDELSLQRKDNDSGLTNEEQYKISIHCHELGQITNRSGVIDLLKNKEIRVQGLMERLKKLRIKEMTEWETAFITKISSRRYKVTLALPD